MINQWPGKDLERTPATLGLLVMGFKDPLLLFELGSFYETTTPFTFWITRASLGLPEAKHM